VPQYNIGNPAGSAWNGTFALKNADGTPQNITGRTFEFAIRPSTTDTSTPAAIKITTTGSANGILTTDAPNATIAVSITATAAALIGSARWHYALWMDPGLSTQTCVVDGAFTGTPVAAP
jgi:hypothetical protein